MEICRWSSVSELRCVIQLAAGTRVLVPGTPGTRVLRKSFLMKQACQRCTNAIIIESEPVLLHMYCLLLALFYIKSVTIHSPVPNLPRTKYGTSPCPACLSSQNLRLVFPGFSRQRHIWKEDSMGRKEEQTAPSSARRSIRTLFPKQSRWRAEATSCS